MARVFDFWFEGLVGLGHPCATVLPLPKSPWQFMCSAQRRELGSKSIQGNRDLGPVFRSLKPEDHASGIHLDNPNPKVKVGLPRC